MQLEGSRKTRGEVSCFLLVDWKGVGITSLALRKGQWCLIAVVSAGSMYGWKDHSYVVESATANWCYN